ncbi:MAG: 3D domain-containing protein, partial [Candidatus Wildermuthbacteria bacterium]|nr:3D domain-containing protein [Candidatus Wildermuthbacteria bacterium]
NSTPVIENGVSLLISQDSALISTSNPNNPDPEVIQKINVVITAYSSTEWQTDDTPFITAAGTSVRNGIIANNYLPFGTKIRIPALYGDRVFTVEDRMSWTKGNYHFDIWFPDYSQAVNFGAKRTYIEILES